MKYNADDITVDKWAELKPISDDRWEQVWDIVLKKPITETINLEDISQELSHEEIELDVRIKVREGKYLTVYVTFSRVPNPYYHDNRVFAIYKMFEDIEQLLGPIDTIQGEKKEERWSPYRRIKKD